MKGSSPLRSPVAAAGLLVVCLAALLALGLGVGPAGIGLGQALEIIGEGLWGDLDLSETAAKVVWQVRLPRLMLALLVGASLALSGVVMQGVFRNPMADPFLVGVSSGAALGATTAVFLGIQSLSGVLGVPVFAFAGALAVSFAVYVLAYQAGRVPVLNLLLVGIALGALCQGFVALLLHLSPSTDVQQVFFWLMGNLAGVRWVQVGNLAPSLLLGFVFLFWWGRDLDLLLLGEDEAASLGVRVEWTKAVLIAVAALLAAAAVSVSGVIGFVGLMVPHIVRLWVGPKHRPLMLLAAPAGAALVLAADLAARSLAGSELPVGIVTTLIGVPFFLFLLRRKRTYFFS